MAKKGVPILWLLLEFFCRLESLWHVDFCTSPNLIDKPVEKGVSKDEWLVINKDLLKSDKWSTQTNQMIGFSRLKETFCDKHTKEIY